MTYRISSIEGNRQRLDGGAMFGNVPRALWEQWIPADERNRIELACRAFLIEDVARERKILLETGIGVFFEPKLQDRYGVIEPHHALLHNLAARDVEPEDIDVVVLSHLHFDHAGGLLTPWRPNGTHELVFPRARFVVGARHWERARSPHFRDRASFIQPMLDLLEQTGRLERVEGARSESLGEGFSFRYSDGHTPGLMLTEIAGEGGGAVFCGDLIPGVPWIHLPVTMGYDRYPELLIDEKQALLEQCVAQGTRLLLTHDAGCASCRVGRNDTGRFAPLEPVAELSGLSL